MKRALELAAARAAFYRSGCPKTIDANQTLQANISRAISVITLRLTSTKKNVEARDSALNRIASLRELQDINGLVV